MWLVLGFETVFRLPVRALGLQVGYGYDVFHVLLLLGFLRFVFQQSGEGYAAEVAVDGVV